MDLGLEDAGIPFGPVEGTVLLSFSFYLVLEKWYSHNCILHSYVRRNFNFVIVFNWRPYQSHFLNVFH